MEYFCQHNGKGKTHLLNDDLKVLCGSKGDFNFSDHYNLVIRGNEFYEKLQNPNYENKLDNIIVEHVYCSKCLKKAKNEEDKSKI